ncbi:hypothetical protein QA599_15835, partial [Haloarculaceae archaeon H-GB1-1]|nr:hypothetical protein [Haloarculaceae archaeon H-GB1-1]
PGKAGRLGGNVSIVDTNTIVVSSGHTRRPSITELPRLTSDPIYTADRRGGILIPSDLIVNPRRA